MKKCLIAGTSLILAFAFCFVCIGYAQLVDTLTITGKAEAKPPEDIYITSVDRDRKGNGVVSETSSFEFQTTVNTSATMSSSTSSTIRSQRTVTYKITVYNNTKYKYVYKGIEGTINSNIKSITTKTEDNKAFNKDEATVDPGKTVAFSATYTYSDSKNLASQTIESRLVYKFGIHIDSLGDMALDRVLIRFREILNTESTYLTLIDKIDDKYVNQDWQANYIGNVGGANSNDTKVVEGLFGDTLSLTIDGVTKNIKLLIKRDNFDNNQSTGDSYVATNGNNRTENKGCEMALYMTANDLDKVIDPGEYSGNRNAAEVYLAVFTCESDSKGNPVGDWYLIGDVYSGHAPIVAYDGSTNGTGSFITDDWTSIQTTYQVTNNYSYTIGKGNGRDDGVQDIQQILVVKDANAISEYNRLYTIAQRELNYIRANADYFNEEVFLEPIAKLESVYQTASAMNVNSNTYRAHVVRILKELENAVYPFLSYIGEK